MDHRIISALKAITISINLDTGLTHPNDMNRTKELLKAMHDAGITLQIGEMVAWAGQNGWNHQGAKELGRIAAKINEGRIVQVKEGPWWKPEFIKQIIEVNRNIN